MDKNKKKKYNKRRLSDEIPIIYDSLDENAKIRWDEIFAETNRLVIKEMREVGKDIGVQSPTTLHKDELALKITQLKLSRSVYSASNEASPATLTYGDVQQLINDYRKGSLIIDAVDLTGVLKITGGEGWLRQGFAPDPKNDAYVPIIIANDFDLKDGDEIAAKARHLNKAVKLGVFNLISINGKPAVKFKRGEPQKPKSPDKRLDIKAENVLTAAMSLIAPFFLGERRLVIGLNALKTEEVAVELAQKYTENGIGVIKLFLDRPPESGALSGLGIWEEAGECADYDDPVSLAARYAKTQAESGKDIAIIVNNAGALSEKTLIEVLAAGRKFDNGSVTSVVLSSSLELQPVINKLTRFANSLTVFKRGIDPMISLGQSFSDFYGLIPNDEIDALNECRRQFGEGFVSCRHFVSAYGVHTAFKK